MTTQRARYGGRFFVRLILALAVGGVFLYAGALKVRDPLRFASDIDHYQMIPWTVGVRLAFYLPWLEILCGLALVFQRLFAGAIVLSGGLMLVFLVATAWARLHGIDITCGCFGTASSNLSLTWHLVLDGGILAALLVLWLIREPAPAAGPA